MKILYLDESGDHNLSQIDPHYPLFVLGGAILYEYHANNILASQMDVFKQNLFGTTDLILHTADITRNRKGFERLKDPVFREMFYVGLNNLMLTTSYKVVACVIRKYEHRQKYGAAAYDPYCFSLEMLVERFCYELRDDHGVIIAEKRDPILDHALVRAWEKIKAQGTRYVDAETINNHVLDLEIRDKKENIPGLQLADLVVSPIGRHVLGKPDKEDWQIVNQKFRCNGAGLIDGYGLVVLPK